MNCVITVLMTHWSDSVGGGFSGNSATFTACLSRMLCLSTDAWHIKKSSLRGRRLIVNLLSSAPAARSQSIRWAPCRCTPRSWRGNIICSMSADVLQLHSTVTQLCRGCQHRHRCWWRVWKDAMQCWRCPALIVVFSQCPCYVLPHSLCIHQSCQSLSISFWLAAGYQLHAINSLLRAATLCSRLV